MIDAKLANKSEPEPVTVTLQPELIVRESSSKME
jgi:hypothetical protein